MNLLKALATVSSFTLLSRITGFVRDAIIARVFGAGMLTDAFFVAFRIPNLLRRLFAEGAFSQAFVPVLAQQRTKQGDQAARELIDQVTSRLAASLLITCVIGVLAAPLIVYVSAPGFSARPEKFALTVELLRITFPYILFISLTALASGVLNTWGNFWVPAFTPVLLNVSFIVFSLWLSSYFDRPVIALAWAVVAGGVAQLAFQLYFLWRRGLFPRFNWQPLQEAGRRILKLMAPAIFGVSVAQISLLINTIFASFLVTGSVSWLYYADRLMEFPSGLLGVALSTILLPSLARLFSSGAKEDYAKLLDWGLRLTFLLTLPAAVALAILAVPLISTLFYHGAFTAEDLWQTRKALVAYSVGLIGIILVKILAPGFYAKQDIKTPVKIAVVTLVATQLMNVIFIDRLRHAGLALAIGLGACLNAALLFRGLRRDGIYQPQPGWPAFFSKVMIALAVMAALLWWAVGSHGAWLEGRFWQRALHLSWVVALGAGSYFASLWLLGFRLRDFVMRAAS